MDCNIISDQRLDQLKIEHHINVKLFVDLKFSSNRVEFI